MELCRSLLFRCGVSCLFGAKFLERHGAKAVYDDFFAFESWFEIAAAPIPHALLPRFRTARARLLQRFTESLGASGVGDFEGSPVGQYLAQHSGDLERRLWPQLLLATLWASQANTAPSLFWVVAMLSLPENKGFLDRVLTDVSYATGRGGSQLAAALKVASDPDSFIHKCVSEAIRLKAPGIDVRVAASDLTVEREGGAAPVVIPKGDMLVVCPYQASRALDGPDPASSASQHGMSDRLRQIHHEDGFWTSAQMAEFLPGRLSDLAGPLKEVPGVRGTAGCVFGGGRFRCPGRFFAEIELAFLASALLSLFEFDLVALAPLQHQQRPVAGTPGGVITAEGAAVAGVPGWRTTEQDKIGAEEEKGSMEHLGEAHLYYTGRSGDPNQRLPPAEMERLVGVKVPKGRCLALIRRK